MYKLGPRRPFRGIKRLALPVEANEDLMNEVFGLGRISKRAKADGINQPGIASVNKPKCLYVLLLKPKYESLVTNILFDLTGTALHHQAFGGIRILFMSPFAPQENSRKVAGRG